MSVPKIVACDLGTSQCKVSVFDSEGGLLASAAESYSPSYQPGNRVEQDPEVWWQAFVAAARQIVNPDEDYACVALTAQMSACLALDAHGSPLRPAMIWADQRATEEAEFFESVIGRERLYTTTGNPPSATYTGSKLLWMKRHEPELFDRTACFVQPKDFLAYRLTDVLVTDYSDASCTSMLDINKWEWDLELLQAVGLPREKLPDVVPSTVVVGHVTARAGEATLLRAGTPVVIGGGDGPAAAVGAGVTSPGSGYINLGSSAWVSYCEPRPLYDPGQRTFNYCHLVPGMYALTGTMQSAGSSYAWALDLLFESDQRVVESLGGDWTALIDQAVAEVPVGANGVIFLPYLIGERTPYWNPNAAGAFIGLRPHHTRFHLLRAVVESIACHLRLIQQVFAEQGVSADEMIMIGGGSSNALLMQICSDVFQKRLVHGRLTTAATSFGAAVAGAVGVGILDSFDDARRWFAQERVVEPDPTAAVAYDALFARFCEAYRLLEPLFNA